MQLQDLFLNRQLYKADQSYQYPDSIYSSAALSNAPSTFIAYGGNSAFDVNNNTPNINGDKIRTGAVESTQYSYVSGIYSAAGTTFNLNDGSIRSLKFAIDSSGNAYFKGDISGASGTFTGDITIGSVNAVFKVQTGVGMWLGHANYASAPFRVDMNGNAYASSLSISGYIPTGGAAGDVNAYGTTISGSKITTGSITATQIGANQITADKLTAGTFSVGGTNEPANITIIESSSGSAGSTTSLLNWKSTGGTLRGKIWADSTGYMGYNAIGGRHYFYTNNNENMVLQDGAQAIFNTGISVRGAFNVGIPNGTTQVARFTDYVYFDPTSSTSQYIIGGSNNMNYNATTYHYFKIGGSEAVKISSVGVTLQGYLYQPNANHIDLGAYTLTLTSNKTAIVPTSKGFNALYCLESPEVWFMDFCEEKGKLDPLFAEVTVSPYHYIKCEDGGYQVWGKRKGHENKRFEYKSEAEFLANERFLKMNQP